MKIGIICKRQVKSTKPAFFYDLKCSNFSSFMDPRALFTMEWQTISLSSGSDPTWYDSQEYYDVGSSYQFGSLAHSQTPSYPSEVRINTYGLHLDPTALTIVQVSDWTSKTSSPLDSSSLCPSQMTPPNFLRNMSNMSSCIGLGYVENRHLTCVEPSESCQTSEILPIERQDPKSPYAANALSLLKMRNLVSIETGSSEQTNSSKGRNPRRCTQCQIRRKKVINRTSDLLGPHVNLGF